MIQGKNWKVFQGSNLDVLPTLEDNSVDAIVTDPPYELGFMGKKWDSSGIAYNVELWRECLRVLKPGGHLLAFSGSRTYHRMVVAIEDAGFEIRDMISWISNKTFPKSLDIGKAIDKSDAAEARRKRDLEFTAWIRSTGLTASQIDKITESNMGGHYTTAASQPAVATAELFDKLRPYLPEVPDHIEKMVAERTIESQNFKNRKVIGERKQRGSQSGVVAFNTADSENEIITAPATPEAQQWEGWGTALKPTVEPIVMARKPLIGTVAENVLTYGTGGLNIDGSRIGTENITINTFDNGAKPFGDAVGEPYTSRKSQGRWPANVILNPYTAELLDEQSGITKSGKSGLRTSDGFNANAYGKGMGIKAGQDNGEYGDSGGASRFFYVARASKRDRNEGLEKSNSHPTVKPTTLMQYLIKLVTPPGGVVLDPFTGSGSTGKAAILQGFSFIGIELTEEYLPIIEGRLKWAEAKVAEEQAKKDEALF